MASIPTNYLEGRYAAIGWLNGQYLSQVHDREEIKLRFRQANPAIHSNLVIRQQVGQIARFLFDIKCKAIEKGSRSKVVEGVVFF